MIAQQAKQDLESQLGLLESYLAEDANNLRNKTKNRFSMVQPQYANITPQSDAPKVRIATMIGELACETHTESIAMVSEAESCIVDYKLIQL